MKMIETAARKQKVWREPEDPETAAKILMDVKLDKVFPPNSKKNGRKRRLSQLSWLTLSKDYRSQDAGGGGGGGGGGDDDDDDDGDDDDDDDDSDVAAATDDSDVTDVDDDDLMN